jgi:hypothetical protein
MEDAGPTPQAGQPSPLSAPAVARPRQSSRRGSRWPLIAGLVMLLAAGGAAIALLILHSSHASRAAAGRSPQHSAGQPLPTAATTAPSSQQQAAEGLAALLAQSVKDRGAVVNAVSDVNQCGPSLSQDPQAFQNAATSRQDLLSRLAALPGRSSLPGQMLQALASAWQASVEADQDYAQWAQDELSRGCTRNDHSDPNYQAATGPDDRATAGKKAFSPLWDPIAAEYGLPAYQWNQL